ncbi:MAG: GH3 auxin-responsive promoter family protein [Blastocatellia bacterium]|nr:GH3 auxin-responsive promoter family protein [Blastocatellia bacterium]
MFEMIKSTIKPFLRPRWERFQESLSDPAQAQQNLLKELIGNLSATEYGRSLKVGPGDDYDAFSDRVPISDYDRISEWVERQKREEGGALVAERVIFYEKTSGSSGPAKYIPYTAGLKDSFSSMFAIWIYDLLERGPRLETGRTFISVSPAFNREQTTERGKKVGLDDDSEYLSPWMKNILQRFLVLPPSIKNLSDPANFKHVLAALLLADSRLEVISIWNPSLLQASLDYIQENSATLCDDLQTGSVTREDLAFEFEPVADNRSDILKESAIPWTEVWPHLKLISCWTSAHAATAARRIGEAFPGVMVQGKGLLATEAPLTLPLIEAGGFVPLPSEVFYEFLDTDGNVSLMSELEAGREYEILLTQKGGLYRYRIGDRVRVTHYYRSTPCLDFAGRADEVCDMVGEKLNANFVQDCLERLSIRPGGFQTLLPVMPERGACYYLLVIDEELDSLHSIEEELDSILREAYHYRNARLLGQLGPAKICVAQKARERYYEYFMSKGMKWGDIKHRYLIRDLEDAANLMEAFGLSH